MEDEGTDNSASAGTEDGCNLLCTSLGANSNEISYLVWGERVSSYLILVSVLKGSLTTKSLTSWSPYLHMCFPIQEEQCICYPVGKRFCNNIIMEWGVTLDDYNKCKQSLVLFLLTKGISYRRLP